MSKFFDHRDKDCIFCNLKRKRSEENEFAFAIKDNFPVTKDHHLVIPKRHVADYFDLEQSEINSVNKILFSLKDIITNLLYNYIYMSIKKIFKNYLKTRKTSKFIYFNKPKEFNKDLKIAIIVPYRDNPSQNRKEHLKQFLEHFKTR